MEKYKTGKELPLQHLLQEAFGQCLKKSKCEDFFILALSKLRKKTNAVELWKSEIRVSGLLPKLWESCPYFPHKQGRTLVPMSVSQLLLNYN